MSEINFFNVDCVEFMKSKPDNYYDLAIVDPPYGIGAENHAGKQEKGWTQWKQKEWDKATPNKQYFDELFRVSKNQIVWGGNYMTDNLNPSMWWIIWDKCQRDFSLADGEMAWSSFQKAMRIFTYARAKALKEGKIHPTQKPVDLYRWILKNYAKPNDKILDTHGGSMSSAIACEREGFDLDICELDSEYFQNAVQRYKLHKRQQVLF